MSKSKWKIPYMERFKGKGKTWFKTSIESSVGQKVKNFLDTTDDSCARYVESTKEKGFYWICFQNIVGKETDYNYLFEIRYKGSNENHRKDTISLSEEEFNSLTPLGNTPKKLGLEVNKKLKLNKIKTQGQKEEKPRLTRRNLDRRVKTKKKIVEETVRLEPCKPSTQVFLPGRDDFYFFREFLVKEGAL